MGVVAKRSSMTFFSDSSSHYSHRVRIVLAEKGVTVDLVEADSAHPPAELSELNPYNSLPTLVDRDLVLYESKVMMEYLDERFPHPPLLPVYPVARAESRLFIHRIERDWCTLVDAIQNELCDGPRSQNDYIELAREFHAVLISGVPAFTVDMSDQARRFINLVDEFYDRNVKLVLAAEKPLLELYSSGNLEFEFQRTQSRLQEMQSYEYLAREHRP